MNLKLSWHWAVLILTVWCTLPVAHADLLFNFGPTGTFSGTAPWNSIGCFPGRIERNVRGVAV